LATATRSVPRPAIVPHRLAVRAAERYGRTGERDPDREWVGDRNATYG